MKPVTKLERIKKYKFVYFQRYRALVISIFGIWALYPYPYSYWTRSLCPYFSRNMPFDCLLKTEKQYNSGKNHMKIVWHHSKVFATGGGEGREGSRGSCTPSTTKKKKKKINFQNMQVTAVSVSNIRDIVSCRCSEIMQPRNFMIFTMYATIFR